MKKAILSIILAIAISTTVIAQQRERGLKLNKPNIPSKQKDSNAKDKNGLSREGSGRVAINKDANIRLVHCYTLESNYHNGRRVNTLAPKVNKATGLIE